MRPPPPAALVRAGASHSDRLFSLIALANRICRLAADIERIDKTRLQARTHRSSSPCPTQQPSDAAVICDFLCPGAIKYAERRAAFSSSRARQLALIQRKVSIPSTSLARQRSPLTPLSPQRHASTAVAPVREVGPQSNHHIDHASYHHCPSAEAVKNDLHDMRWPSAERSLTGASSKAPAMQLDHWDHPWEKSSASDAKSRSLPKVFDQVISSQRKQLEPGSAKLTSGSINGITLRRLQAHDLWHLYRTNAHRQTLFLHTRIQIAIQLALHAHRTTANKANSAQSKALRYLFGRRIDAIFQDCQFFIAQRSKAAVRSADSLLHHQGMNMALLRPMSMALMARPVAALKAMDQVLHRHRPDIDRYKHNGDRVTEHLSPIDLTLRTVIDSLNFEVHCRPDPATVAQAVRSQSDFFSAGNLLEDLKNGQVNLFEGKRPLQDCLNWFMDSPHAYLLEHKAFKGARSSFLRCLSKASDPHALLDALSLDHEPEEPAFVQACDVLLRSVIIHKTSHAALDLYDDLWSRGVPLSSALVDRLIQTSTGQGPSDRLEVLLHRETSRSASKLPTRLLRNVAMNWAMRNRPDHAYRFKRILAARGGDRNHAFSQRLEMELDAGRGDLKGLHEKLAQIYDFHARTMEECTVGKKPLTSKAFALLLKACNRADDIDLAEQYLMEALDRGVKVRSSDFNSLIDMHARKTNIDAALAIFEQMKEFGVSPDKYTFTTLIHGFALRHDPEAAAHTLRAMVAAGKVPDRVTYAALLDCYVESGLYDSAIRLFAWMQAQPDSRLRPTIEICNIILKAYVLSSLPVQKVMQLVNTLTKKGLRPNANTYALMLQSACDAGLMDIAEEIFSEAEKALPNVTGSGSGQGANLYHFTIMIHGYLRVGDHTEAKEYFDEMRNRKLQPSAVTWAIMVRSYAQSENETNYDLANTLVSQLIADESKKVFKPSSFSMPDWTVAESKGDQASERTTPATKQGPPFETLYTVLMVAQARRGEPDKVEKTLDELSRTTPQLSVYAMTPLLDAYRRVGDVDSAMQLFERIYHLALEAAISRSHRLYAYAQPGSGKAGSAAESLSQRRQDANSRNLLCLPVSIMIDLLSTAGRHDEIARMWSRAKNDGFGFDSDNWNHLAASMARAGQLEEALSVVQHVLHHDPPNAWMRSRLSEDGRQNGRQMNAIADNDDRAPESRDEHMDDFDPMPSNASLDPATAHRPDAASRPSRPPNRRHQARADDDPYVELPFDIPDSFDSELDVEGNDLDGDRRAPAQADTEQKDYAEPSAFYLDADSSFSLARDLKSNTTFSPWYAHFETMESISQGLAKMREAHKVIALLDKYSTAARLLDLHERKVEIIKERQKEEAVRSARDLIDGRT